jgi:hypothetical protein
MRHFPSLNKFVVATVEAYNINTGRQDASYCLFVRPLFDWATLETRVAVVVTVATESTRPDETSIDSSRGRRRTVTECPECPVVARMEECAAFAGLVVAVVSTSTDWRVIAPQTARSCGSARRTWLECGFYHDGILTCCCIKVNCK